MNDVAISVKDLSKRYKVYDSPWSRVRHALLPSNGHGAHEIRALEEVSFEVRRGESLAVIGRNGGGKTTLLEILAGTLTPSAGEVRVNGRISALLELGSGFNPEYSGRDNVILNGLLIGLERDEILRRFPEIEAFAEIGEAIERPVKTYSSGMMMRLAFAVQVLTDPDILIVDEALSVGDFFFQQKCFGRIRELCGKGVTLVFVSHDMGTVRDLCRTAVYLRGGRVAYAGNTQDAIRAYLAEANGRGTVPAVPMARVDSRPGETSQSPAIALWRRPPAQTPGPLLAVEVLGKNGEPAESVRMGERILIRVHFVAAPHDAGHISLVIKNRYDQIVTTIGSLADGLPALSSGTAAHAVFQIEVDMMLEAGLYSLMVAFARPTAKNRGEPIEDTGWIGPLRVDWDYEHDTAPFLGMFGLPARGQLLEEERR